MMKKAHMHPGVPKPLQGRRFRLLLVSLFLFLAFAGIRPQDSSGVLLVIAFFGIVLVAMWTIRRDHRATIVAAILAALSLTNPDLDLLPASPLSSVIHQVAGILFLGLISTYILRHVLRQDEVTEDTVSGSCCVYLMLGILWSRVYSLIELATPHSFTFTATGATTGGRVSVDQLYYSYVTLTTLGYGDMAPLSQAARIFSAMEALVGQLFVAILIAYLVGMHASSKRARTQA